MEITKKILLSKLPVSKKLELLGNEYISALTAYYDSNTPTTIDIDELLFENFDRLLIEKNVLIRMLQNFDSENLSTITGNLDISIGEIRTCLVRYFQIEIPPVIPESNKATISECGLELHDFQERIRRKVINLIFDKKRRFLIHMPTGAGKTRMACEIIIDFIRLNSVYSLLNEKMKILWVAQGKELCVQAFQTFELLYNTKGTIAIEYGHFYGDQTVQNSIVDKPAIIFCSIQKLMNHYTEDLWQMIREQNYLVVVDEAHRSIAAEWVKALDHFTKNHGAYLIGLTATPGASNPDTTFGLSSYYNNQKIGLMDHYYSDIEKPIQYLTERKFLAEVERYEIVSNIRIEDGLESQTEIIVKTKESTLSKLAVDASRNGSIKNIVEENHRLGKKILIFSCGEAHNRILRDILRLHNINSEIIDAGSFNREAIIENFRNGNLNVLINFGVLIAGFDAPNTDVCIIARPVESIVMYSQMVGRILRGAKNIKGWTRAENKINRLYTIRDNLGHGSYDSLYNSFNDFWN